MTFRRGLVAAAALALLLTDPAPQPAPQAQQLPQTTASVGPRAFEGSLPNIVLIVTDDQRFDEVAGMPVLRRSLLDRGMRFKRGFVSNPLCCPSRTSILTGRYSHSTGIYLNGDGGWPGGFEDFADSSTIATWLQQGGYRTGLVGKYLNHYEDGSYVPPGWSYWRAQIGENAQYYDYALSIDGTTRRYGSKPADYATDVEARLADRFIRTAPQAQPLFLYLAPPAPHGPRTPPHRYLHLPTHSMPMYPSFNERAIADKPAYLRAEPGLNLKTRTLLKAQWARAEQTLRAVDDAIAGVVTALADTDRLHNTLFVVTSDNGTAFGEHRWAFKLTPHEESIRVPLVMRWPGHITPGSATFALATNIDLAPTFAAAAGVAAPAVDGVSLLPLLRTGDPVRSSFLIEHRFSHRKQDPPTYCGIRTTRWKMVVYATGEREMYDLRRDPYELVNKATEPGLASQRHRLMDRLRTLCSPRPPGMPPF